MSVDLSNHWLDRPVDPGTDHVLGPVNAPITLVEYGSYACPYCRAANDRIAEVRDRLGDRLLYVFRHKPLTGSDLARRAAELVERASDSEHFWKAHVTLMSRSETLTEDDLVAAARELDLPLDDAGAEDMAQHAFERVSADISSAKASGVMITPTFFINGRRYDGAWDESSFGDAVLGTLGHRVRIAALDFAGWAPSAGILLLLTTVLAVALTNSPMGEAFEHFWHQTLGVTFGSRAFNMSLLHWINDGLLTIFFLVVGLEIKREFTVGHLSSPRLAALPIAAAIGGMVVPAAIYLSIIPAGPWLHGWGTAMATDTAFAVALIAMMGSRVPVELRIFLTAAAIVDDIGSIIVVAVFYTGDLEMNWLGAGVVVLIALAMLNRWRFYNVTPYALLGIVLWACVHAGGLHATLAGVLLALFIPTRPPANLKALTVQASTIMGAEYKRAGEALHHGPSGAALRALDAIHDRLESPADRLLRHSGARSSYIVLPLFAFANAGVAFSLDVFNGHGSLMAAIGAGLLIGKPLGLVGASALAVALRIAVKPIEYSWRQLAGAGALAGIGFTMSLFIAGEAFPVAGDYAAAKIAVFAASVLSAIIGVAILWNAKAPEEAA
ncbi:Na+/H+ antiporter NhaA [Undibacter mobilis]|uniref:Na(+)/H(+) antiporter NhaA n=1 Tax=Undibacter mobilis TaxID=2292256 RepID=A0A371B116_9BRAD|nr:Na+/H+ antiporter NhaA [Undibacter mobilis]RDV01248.1 Na+/H+ antiporter NhaA [Undibacter mobilis]